MALDQMVVDKLLTLVRRRFPDWAGFSDPAFEKDERDYKLAAVRQAAGPDGLLLERPLRDDLDGRAFESFIKRFEGIGHTTNLLYQSTPSTGDLNVLYAARDAGSEVLEGLCAALLDLLWGSGSSPERLGRYLEYVNAHELPNKWTFPTYFLFLTHPDEDVFVKPVVMSRVAEELGAPWSTKGKLSAAGYGAIVEWAEELREAVRSYGPRDMVDIQSLLWVAGCQLTEPDMTSYWKIAPGEQAWNWDACREGGFIGIGWEDLGDLSSMTREQFEARRDEIVAREDSDWKVKGANQAWRFAQEIKPGDEIVANLGTSRVLGFGRVTGPYEYLDGVRHGQRLPVEWYDTRPRQLPSPRPGWRSTLVALEKHDFEALLALPPEDAGTGLGPPFDAIFGDRAEADWAFDLVQSTHLNLGVEDANDERIAVTLPKYGSLHVDFAHWLVMGFEPISEQPSMGVAIRTDTPGADRYPGGAFGNRQGDTPFSLKWLARSDFRADPSLVEALAGAQNGIAARFPRLKRSAFRKYHVPELGQAVFDKGVRDELLRLGLEEYRRVHPSQATGDAAFTVAARDLLTDFRAAPTKDFYFEHKAELAAEVQEPLQSLLLDVGRRVADPLRDAMETEHKLFSVFTKNDYGRGGAWPFYWGAFYPKGGKKIQGCQLFVFVDGAGLKYGFSVGDYGSEERKLLTRNRTEHRDALLEILGETVNAPEFEFGEFNETDRSRTASDVEGLDLAGWLEHDARVGEQVHVLIPWPQLLATSRDDLVADVADAFNRLFPLVLLATRESPLSAIQRYVEVDGDDLNPDYSLDELADETSLPVETLESWLRAIERKGQAILYGPPGTGKTYVAERLAKHLIAGGPGTAELIQFHPAYAYEDFMQGMRPKGRDGGGLDYPVVPGRFMQFCEEARGRKGRSVLIIDEVNRANLARVFGELMYLLEYREKTIPLASGGRFGIPANVRLIGTMNTADRSIALVDHALRRRFAFLPLYPDYLVLSDFHAKRSTGFDPGKLIELLRDLNRKIGDRHYEVGTSFFLRTDIAEQLPDVWRMEIEPYLEEYFFDQQGTVDSFRWDEVSKRLETD